MKKSDLKQVIKEALVEAKVDWAAIDKINYELKHDGEKKEPPANYVDEKTNKLHIYPESGYVFAMPVDQLVGSIILLRENTGKAPSDFNPDSDEEPTAEQLAQDAEFDKLVAEHRSLWNLVDPDPKKQHRFFVTSYDPKTQTFKANLFTGHYKRLRYKEYDGKPVQPQFMPLEGKELQCVKGNQYFEDTGIAYFQETAPISIRQINRVLAYVPGLLDLLKEGQKENASHSSQWKRVLERKQR